MGLPILHSIHIEIYNGIARFSLQ